MLLAAALPNKISNATVSFVCTLGNHACATIIPNLLPYLGTDHLLLTFVSDNPNPNSDFSLFWQMLMTQA